MKRNLVIICCFIFTALLSYEAKAQCEDCISPKQCMEVTYYADGCGHPTAYICYECSPTSNYVHVEVLEIRNIYASEECVDVSWDALFEWIKNNVDKLCGNIDCDDGHTYLKITKPKCANLIYDHDNGSISIQVDITLCGDRRCVTEYEWCTCYCTPSCWDPKCNTQPSYTKITPISGSWVGTGSCDFTPYGPGTDYPFTHSWIINCQELTASCP